MPAAISTSASIKADLSLVLRGGEIVAEVNFSELLRARGLFALLYQTQFGLYEGEHNIRRVK